MSWFFGGEIKGESRVVHINSKNRRYGSSSDFGINLPNFINNSYKYVVCTQAYIPKSYYMVNNSDYFILIENSVSVNIQLTAGNYTRSSFASSVQNKLNSESPNGYTYAISYNRINSTYDDGKFTFTVTGNSGIQPQFEFKKSDIGGNFYEMMGFNSDTIYNFSGDQLKSINVIKISLEDTLFIHSDMCTNIDNNVLQEVFTVNSSTYGSIVWQNVDTTLYAKKLAYTDSNTYRFYLTDENNKIIDLNGQNWICTIVLF